MLHKDQVMGVITIFRQEVSRALLLVRENSRAHIEPPVSMRMIASHHLSAIGRSSIKACQLRGRFTDQRFS
jgi:hypothetical protein